MIFKIYPGTLSTTYKINPLWKEGINYLRRRLILSLLVFGTDAFRSF